MNLIHVQMEDLSPARSGSGITMALAGIHGLPVSLGSVNVIGEWNSKSTFEVIRNPNITLQPLCNPICNNFAVLDLQTKDVCENDNDSIRRFISTAWTRSKIGAHEVRLDRARGVSWKNKAFRTLWTRHATIGCWLFSESTINRWEAVDIIHHLAFSVFGCSCRLRPSHADNRRKQNL